MYKLFLFITVVFMASCYNDKHCIGIQPYNGFDSTLIPLVADSIKQTYGCEVVVLKPKALPQSAFINVKSPRYRADSLLIDLKHSLNDSIKYVIGLTHKDISTTKRGADGEVKKPAYKYSDWGIFGLGYRPGPTCIVSTYRLQNKNKDLFISRFIKVSIHELGHNMGLKHCPTEGCVMMDAEETIKTVDREGYELCKKCKSQIE